MVFAVLILASNSSLKVEFVDIAMTVQEEGGSIAYQPLFTAPLVPADQYRLHGRQMVPGPRSGLLQLAEIQREAGVDALDQPGDSCCKC